MSTERLFLNGINALTGQYLVPAFTLEEAAARLRGTKAGADREPWLVQHGENLQNNTKYAMPVDVQPEDVTQAGWGVVFTPDTPAEIRKALQPLLDRRKGQVSEKLFKILEYRRGESREQWLGKYGAHGSDVVPEKVPYYLLLVGGPEQIPFDFQFLIDVDYAVGRLAFD